MRSPSKSINVKSYGLGDLMGLECIDKTVYVEKGLRNQIPHGKKVITDRVYGSKAEPDDRIKLALPNPSDNKELANCKVRIRARHESFNDHLKFHKSLLDTYQHSAADHACTSLKLSAPLSSTKWTMARSFLQPRIPTVVRNREEKQTFTANSEPSLELFAA
jgi:hypothetical protein